MSTNSVFVANIPEQATEASLGKYFGAIGRVNTVKLVKNQAGKKGHYFGFVHYYRSEDAIRAVKLKNSGDFMGSHLLVKLNSKLNTSSKSPNSYTPKTVMPQNINARVTPKEPLMKEAIICTLGDTSASIYVQIVNDTNKKRLLCVTDQLPEMCEKTPRLTSSPAMNVMYAAKFSADNMWYRCKVVKLISESQSEVLYVDYGNRETVQNTEMVQLSSPLTDTAPCAELFHFYNVTVADGREEEAKKLMADFMTDHSDQKRTLKIYSSPPDIYSCDVILPDDSSLVDRLLSSGHYRHLLEKPGAFIGASAAPKQVSFQRPSSTPMSSTSRAPQDRDSFNGSPSDKTYVFANVVETNSSRNRPLLPQTKTSSASQFHGEMGVSRMSAQYAGNAGFGPPTSAQLPQPDAFARGADENRALKAQLHSVQQQLAEVKQNDVRRQSELSRHMAEVENTSLKKRVAELTAENEKLRAAKNEDTFSIRLKTVENKVRKARELRSQIRFDVVKDELQQAFEVIQSEEKFSLDLNELKAVRLATDYYNERQEAVRESMDLDEPRVERDRARSVLFEALRNFLEAVNIRDVDARRLLLRDTKNALIESHSALIPELATLPASQVDLVALQQTYDDWKRNRRDVCERVRSNSNLKLRHFCEKMAAVQKALELGSNCGELPDETLLYALKDYNDAVKEEISVSDMNSELDLQIVTAPLASILNAIERELTEVTQMSRIYYDYKKSYENLEPWLERRPDLQDLTLNKERIRLAKSALRHIHADYDDFVEASDATVELLIVPQAERKDQHEMEKLLVQLNDCKNEVQAAIYEEEKLMLYQGLLKTNRSLQFYETEQKMSVEAANLNEFMMQVLRFNNADSIHLNKAEAVIYLEKENTAIVQQTCHDHSLADSVSTLKSAKDKIVLLQHILHALARLHEANLVHGAVSPSSVFMINDTATLDMPELSVAATQRSKNNFKSDKNLEFVAPESLESPPICDKHSDMFCFGILTLWVFFPWFKFPVEDGVPDYSNVSLDPHITEMLDNLLSLCPEDRISAEEALQLTVFAEAESHKIADDVDEANEKDADDDSHVDDDLKAKDESMNGIAEEKVTDADDRTSMIDDLD